jgi:plasmid stabilization system protein ParE
MNAVRYHPEALEEFEASADWYEVRNPDAAWRFVVEVERLVLLIREQPKLFPKLDRRFRSVVLNGFPYYIVYLEMPNLTYIIAIAHGSKAPNYWRNRKIV